jgi:hypothetical protein
MTDEFSKRYGFKKPPKRLVRDAAPEDFRRALLAVFERFGYSAQDIGELICHLMREIPNEQLGLHPSWYVVGLRLNRIPWYAVFDLVQGVCYAEGSYPPLENDINECFKEYGIAWKLVDGRVQECGDEIHEGLIQDATDALTSTGRSTAAAELKKAIEALSARPDADTRGAVIRAVGAVEALARDVLGDSNATLGQLVNKLNLPPPLREAVAKIWGYASDQARHVREGQTIELAEAYLVVNLCATIASHLCRIGLPG